MQNYILAQLAEKSFKKEKESDVTGFACYCVTRFFVVTIIDDIITGNAGKTFLKINANQLASITFGVILTK